MLGAAISWLLVFARKCGGNNTAPKDTTSPSEHLSALSVASSIQKKKRKVTWNTRSQTNPKIREHETLKLMLTSVGCFECLESKDEGESAEQPKCCRTKCINTLLSDFYVKQKRAVEHFFAPSTDLSSIKDIFPHGQRNTVSTHARCRPQHTRVARPHTEHATVSTDKDKKQIPTLWLEENRIYLHTYLEFVSLCNVPTHLLVYVWKEELNHEYNPDPELKGYETSTFFFF